MAPLAREVTDLREFTSRLPVDLRRSLQPLIASAHDPTIRVRDDAFARTSWTPHGPGTLAVERRTGDAFVARAWGPGGSWLLEAAPALTGACDHLDGFDPTRHPAVARAHHRLPGLRMIRSGLAVDVLVPTVIAQRVTAREAAASWTRLVRAHGTPAPGPYPLRLPPSCDQLRSLPSHRYLRLGIDRARARRIISACRAIARIQAGIEQPPGPSPDPLTTVAGVGVWTAAHVRRVAAGDPDAVEVGDDGVKHHVAWNLASEPRADDARMLELLAPFSGHRGRVVRLLASAGTRPPAFAPKRPVVPVESL